MQAEAQSNRSQRNESLREQLRQAQLLGVRDANRCLTLRGTRFEIESAVDMRLRRGSLQMLNECMSQWSENSRTVVAGLVKNLAIDHDQFVSGLGNPRLHSDVAAGIPDALGYLLGQPPSALGLFRGQPPGRGLHGSQMPRSWLTKLGDGGTNESVPPQRSQRHGQRGPRRGGAGGPRERLAEGREQLHHLLWCQTPEQVPRRYRRPPR